MGRLLRPRPATIAAAYLVLAAFVIATCTGSASSPGLAVRVAGNALVDAQGQPIRLLGVNISGTEYSCIQDLGIFAGPTDQQAIAAIASWHVTAVRLPLNEDCWLGINGAAAPYSGARYRAAVRGFVVRLNQAGLYALLDLHWNAPGTARATGQQPMADLDHAPAFWSSMARAFIGDPAVIFDLYNEPHDISWQCWLDGCAMPGGWRAAGMQALVDAVRAAGARQPILVTGLDWGNDLSGWLRYRPHDPANQLVSGLHVYNSLGCTTAACWTASVAPVARTVPVVTGELGDRTCSAKLMSAYMDWADSAGVSYLAWSWNPVGCAGPGLISAWTGMPTGYGNVVRLHLSRLWEESMGRVPGRPRQSGTIGGR